MGLSRRQFFSDLGRTLLQVVPAAPAAPEQGAQMSWLRPPGAASEAQFLECCTRCTDCLEACPHSAIRRLGPEFGPQSGTPAIIPAETPCYLCADLPCVAACNTGALLEVARGAVGMGTVRFEAGACYVQQGQPCDYCVSNCPLRPAAIQWDDRGLPAIDPAHCAGCGVCVYLCPGEALAVSSRAVAGGVAQPPVALQSP